MSKIVNLEDFRQNKILSKKVSEMILTKEERMGAKKVLLFDNDEITSELLADEERYVNKYIEAYKNLSQEEKRMLQETIDD